MPLPPRVSPQVVTAGRHDGAPPLALSTRSCACLLPCRHTRSLHTCSDSMRCAFPCTRAARAGQDVLERRRRSVVVAPTPLTLGVALYQIADAAAQVRRCAELTTRAHSSLASHLSLHCVSRRVQCLSRVLARVHGLRTRRQLLTGSGSRLPCALAGSAPAAVHGGRPRAARWACRYIMYLLVLSRVVPSSRRAVQVHQCVL